MVRSCSKVIMVACCVFVAIRTYDNRMQRNNARGVDCASISGCVSRLMSTDAAKLESSFKQNHLLISARHCLHNYEFEICDCKLRTQCLAEKADKKCPKHWGHIHGYLPSHDAREYKKG